LSGLLLAACEPAPTVTPIVALPTHAPEPTNAPTLAFTPSPTPPSTATPTAVPEPTPTVKKVVDLREWGMGPLLNLSDAEWEQILIVPTIPQDLANRPYPELLNGKVFWFYGLSGVNPTLGVVSDKNNEVFFPRYVVGSLVGFYPGIVKDIKTDNYRQQWIIAVFQAGPNKDDLLAVALPYVDVYRSIGPNSCGFGAYPESDKKLVVMGSFASSADYGGMSPEDMGKFFSRGGKRGNFLVKTRPDEEKPIAGGATIKFNHKDKPLEILLATRVYMLGVDTPEEVEQIIGHPTSKRYY